MKIKLLTTMTTMFMVSQVFALDFSGVHGDNGNYSKSKNFSSASDNNITGTTTNGWKFKNASVTGNSNMTIVKIVKDGDNSSSLYTTNSEDNWIFNFVAFSLTVAGDLFKDGGTGGSPPTFSLTGNRNGEFYIDPTEKVIPQGENITLYAKETITGNQDDGTSKNSNWNISPNTYKSNGENYTAPSLTNLSSITFGSDLNPPDAGVYTIKANPSPVTEMPLKTAQANLTVVGVKEVSVPKGTTTVSSTTDTPGDDETLYIPKGTATSSITISATPEPGSVWPDNYPTWKLDDTAAGTAGSATYSLSTATAGEYTVSAICGTSTKAIKIVVIEIESLAGVRTSTSRKPNSSSPMPIIDEHVTNIITVKTKPAGYEDKAELFISQSGKGEIIRDSNNAAKWLYKSHTESKSEIDVESLVRIKINSKILEVDSPKTINVSVLSVFQFYGVGNIDRDNAWKYAQWKYNISIANLNSVSYKPSQTTSGLTNNYTNNMTLGTDAFAEEWSCASILGHENIHGGQDFLLNTKTKEQEATMWELDHSNAPSCKTSPLTYIYDYCKYYYDDAKIYYASNDGMVTYP